MTKTSKIFPCWNQCGRKVKAPRKMCDTCKKRRTGKAGTAAKLHGLSSKRFPFRN